MRKETMFYPQWSHHLLSGIFPPQGNQSSQTSSSRSEIDKIINYYVFEIDLRINEICCYEREIICLPHSSTLVSNCFHEDVLRSYGFDLVITYKQKTYTFHKIQANQSINNSRYNNINVFNHLRQSNTKYKRRKSRIFFF